MARPVLRLGVISAAVIGARAPVGGRAVRVVDARVQSGVAIVGIRSAALPRGRAISALSAVGVDGAIASRGGARIRDVVGRRATANARRPRRTVRVSGARVVRTPAGPDQTSIWKAAAVRSGSAIGVRRAGGGSGRVGLAGRSSTTLRGAARRGPMVEGNLRVADRGRSRFDDGRHARDGSDGVRWSAVR